MWFPQSVRFRVVPVALVAALTAGCAHREPPEAHATSTKDMPVTAVPRRADAIVIEPARAAVRHSRVEPVRRFNTYKRIATAAQPQSHFDQPRISRLQGPTPLPAAEATPPVKIAAPSRPVAVALSTAPGGPKVEVAAPAPTPKVVAATSQPAPAARQDVAAAAPASAPLEAPILNGGAVPAAAGPKVVFIPAPSPSAQTTSGAAAGNAQQNTIAAAPAVPSDTAPAVGGRPAPSKAPSAVPEEKVASLGGAALVRDALNRADAYIKSGQIINARALLQDAARGESPELLAALAATYDPIVLVDYPAAQKAADAKRAADLYETAIGKGSVAARERLQKLKVYMSRQGN